MADKPKDLAEQLFGSEDEDEDEEEEVPVDRKSKVQELAARKAAERKQAEKQQKSRRSGSDDGAGGEAATAGEGPGYDSENDEEGPRTAADDAFIDDDGADPGQLSGTDSEEEGVDGMGNAPQAEEAEEAMDDLDEFDRITKAAKEGRKRRRGDEDSEALVREVELFLGRMEVAVENDIKANEDRKPAIYKLKLVKEMSAKLSQQHLQRKFLDAGGLTVLTHWLSPLPDGSLPNINIRTAILKLLLQMPIHVEDPERRDQLKKSGLGRVVMFLFKLEEETTDNRRRAKELVERWSRPIFALENKHQNSAGQEVSRRKIEDMPKKKQARTSATGEEDVDEDGNPIKRKGPAPGERGWRWHASIPQMSKLDYAVRPEPKFSQEDMGQKTDGIKAKHDKLDRKLKGMAQKNKRKTGADRPNKISVEGRGMLH